MRTEVHDPLHELLELERRGFLMPPGQDSGRFVDRAREALRWAEGVRESLSTRGRAEVLGETFDASAAIPRRVLEDGLRPAREAYRISPLWVPAFYSNRYLPWYVGGAMFFDPSAGPFRVCLILREGFRRSRRWLIYDRTEIISHELCHVARGAMNQTVFEEALAYRLSGSRLRRLAGGVFRGRWEAPAVLGGAALLAGTGVGEMFGLSPWLKLPAAVPLAGAVGALAWRAARDGRRLCRAAAALQPAFGDAAEAVLFRCTDREVRSLARQSPGEVQQWLEERRQSLRWRLIRRRFLP
jgi:hypothetical protein